MDVLFADRICRCRVSGRSPLGERARERPQPRYKDDSAHGVSTLRYMHSFRNTHVRVSISAEIVRNNAAKRKILELKCRLKTERRN